VKKDIYKSRELAVDDIADYIDSFSNRPRRHSHLGGLSPEQFKAEQKRYDRSPGNPEDYTLASNHGAP